MPTRADAAISSTSNPTAGLTPRAARLDGLIRSMLHDPGWRRGESLESIAARASARQVPAANASLVREAVRRMDALWDVEAFRALREADPASVRYDFTFTMPSGATVYHGACDVLFRDRQGDWQAIVVADAGADRERQELRLELSAGPLPRADSCPSDRDGSSGMARKARPITERCIENLNLADRFGPAGGSLSLDPSHPRTSP